jgi:thiol:disulfide interchange protein DsbD
MYKQKNLLFVLLTLCVLMGSTLSSKAQMVDPVSWTYSLKPVNDSIYELYFNATIEPTWHMYNQTVPSPVQAMAFAFETSSDYKRIDKVVEITKAAEEFDQMFGMKVTYFALEAKFVQKIKALNKEGFAIKGTVDYQICDDKSCSIGSADFSFQIGKSGTATNALASGNQGGAEVQKDDGSTKSSDQLAKTDAPTTKTSGSEIKETATTNTSGSLWKLFWIAFGSGLIALLTPCVFPMIPMTVSFFMHGEKSRKKSLFEAIFFGVSIVAIFAVIGTIVAVAFGPGIANFMSTHWIPNVMFFLIFLFFAAWFFGMFEITLPNWMISKSDQQADKGGIGGPFFMAFTTVLVSFSCTGPIVGTVLVQSAGGEILKPIIGMLGFGIAFALPFTLFAIFPSWLSSLPKSGGWLNSVKVILGFVELALGLKFLSIADQTYHWGILDREVYLAFWIVIFTLMGFYLIGKIKFKHDSDVSHVGVPRLLMAIITFSFVVYMIPGMIGAPLKALAGYLPPETTNDFDLRQVIRDNAGTSEGIGSNQQAICEKPEYSDKLKLPHGLLGYFDYDQALSCAKQQNKPVFIDFTGHGCVNCREMEARVWADPRVLSRLRNNYIVTALYVDDKVIELPVSEWVTSTFDGKVKKTLGKKYQDFQITRFKQNTQPQYALLDTDGNLLIPTRSYDLDVDAFIDFLDRGSKEFENRSKK